MSNLQTLANDARRRKQMKAQKARQALKYLRDQGTAPDWTGITINSVDYDSKLAYALNWASKALDKKALKEQFIKWAEMPELNKVHENNFINVGKLAWILNSGGPLSEKNHNTLKTELQSLINKAAAIKDVKVNTYNPNKYLIDGNRLYCVIDDYIFENKMPNIKAIVYDHKPTKAALKVTFGKLIMQRDELIEFMNKPRQEQIEYGFKNINFKLKIDLLNKSLKELGYEEKIQVKKSKPTNVSKLRLGNNTVPADKLLGAKVAVLYDTEAGWLLIYRSDKGLSIDGLKIINYDTAVGKKYTKDMNLVNKIRTMNQNQFDNLYSSIKNKEAKVSNYTKEKHIILKVF